MRSQIACEDSNELGGCPPFLPDQRFERVKGLPSPEKMPQHERHVATTDDLFGPIVGPIPAANHNRSGDSDMAVFANGGFGRFAGTVHLSAETVAVPAVVHPPSIQVPDLQLDGREDDSDILTPEKALGHNDELRPLLLETRTEDISLSMSPAHVPPAERRSEAPSSAVHVVNLSSARVQDEDADAVLDDALTPVPESPASGQSANSKQRGNGAHGSAGWTLPGVEEQEGPHTPIAISTDRKSVV